MLTLRPATDEDRRLLWQWANDPQVRAASFHDRPIPWNEHVVWFDTRQRDPDCRMYVVVHDGVPVGQVRFEPRGSRTAEVSIALDARYRGRGHGIAALRIACDSFFRASGTADEIVAHIRKENIPSLRAFRKVGFTVADGGSVNGHEAMKMRLTRARMPAPPGVHRA